MNDTPRDFARLYRVNGHQVVVMTTTDDEHAPAVKLFAQPGALIAESCLTLEDSKRGWDKRDRLLGELPNDDAGFADSFLGRLAADMIAKITTLPAQEH